MITDIYLQKVMMTRYVVVLTEGHDDNITFCKYYCKYLQKVPNSLLGTIIDDSIICRAVAHLHDTYIGCAIIEQFPLHFLQNLKKTEWIIL
jgi:hypothetical protein